MSKKPNTVIKNKPDSKKDTDMELAMPQTRNLLPDNHNELFGVNTSSCVITNHDIQQETVLGLAFNKEVEDGRNVFG